MRPDHCASAVHPDTTDATADPAERFAVVIPVGPRAEDLAGAFESVESLLFWEPRIAWCVFIEDRPEPTSLPTFIAARPRSKCKASAFKIPGQGGPSEWPARQSAGMLAALSWIQANTDAGVVFKLDTDALVIAPFAARIVQFLASRPDAGVIGVFDGSCNPAIQAFFRPNSEPHLLMLRRLLPIAPPPAADGSREPDARVAGLRPVAVELRRSFDVIRPHLDDAIGHGFALNRDCQGGSFAVTRLMVERMAAAGYLKQPEVWLDIPIGEDRVLAMYAHAVGLRLFECDAFGVQFKALPYSPEELIARGYSVVHSVKNDRRYSEASVRQFFRERRTRATMATVT